MILSIYQYLADVLSEVNAWLAAATTFFGLMYVRSQITKNKVSNDNMAVNTAKELIEIYKGMFKEMDERDRLKDMTIEELKKEIIKLKNKKS